MSEKIVLFSTTPGMTASCQKVLQQRGYGNIPIYELTTARALAQAEKCIHAGARVIICRGGTAEYLRRFLEVPIVDVRHSFLSVFLAMQRLKPLYDRVAVIGFHRSCETMRKYVSVTGEQVLIYEVVDGEQFEAAFHQGVQAGVQAFLGGFQVQAVCRTYGFPYYSTEPDDSEVSQALDEALYSLRIEEERSGQLGLLSTVLNSVGEGIVSVDSDGIILHTNRIARNLLRCGNGIQIGDLIDADKILQAVRDGENFYGELFSLHGTSIVCSCQAIRLQGKAAGAVITLQEENTIRSLDSHIRKRALGRGHRAKKDFSDILGASAALEEAKRIARRYARADSAVLITGETGVGKEMFTQGIHNHSERRHEPFVAINCAALPQNILESELFGYVRGAFTGARSEGKAGIFELAHKGTVFLDEISEMSPDVQVKLLRVLQEKEVTRIGDDKVIPIDVRIIAACNKDLKQEIAAGRFREDLYYRVCVLELFIPPLRERAEDIPTLVRHFLHGRKSLTTRAQTLMMQYDWPGNIRQLSNITERLDVLCDNDIITEEDVRQVLKLSEKDVPPKAQPASAGPETAHSVKDVERQMIMDALEQTGGNTTQAAQLLGLSKTTLWRRMRAMQTDVEDI